MAKKMMIVCGSPRKNGNTNTLAGWVAEAAEAAGAEVETVDAANLDYKTNGCLGCMKCQASEAFECAIEDEASEVLRRMGAADVVVFATPVYYAGPTAQLKLLLDRTFSLIKINIEDESVTPVREGQVHALVATSGGDMKDGLNLLEQVFQAEAGFTGLDLKTLLVPRAPLEPGQMADNAELKDKAAALGKALATGG